jgi:hypothetical protein
VPVIGANAVLILLALYADHRRERMAIRRNRGK